MKLCITAAVSPELDLLKAELQAKPAGLVAGHPYFLAPWPDHLIHLAEVGIGIVSAAATLGALVSQINPDRMIMLGSAGALPGSGLQTGDLAVATSESLAELGLCLGPGIGSTSALNLKTLEQSLPLTVHMAASLVNAAREITKTDDGNFLTVAGVSADHDQAMTRTKVFSAVVENMEGFALAWVGNNMGIAVGEVRGISNMAGNRDKSCWDLNLANRRAQTAVLHYLRRMV